MGKIKYGIKNLHIAEVQSKEGKYTYGTSKKVAGAVSITLDASGEESEEYADDVIWYKEDTNNGYEGNLEVEMLDDEILTMMFGHEKNTDGAILEKSTDEAKEFALMYEFKVSGDPTIKGKRVVLYRVKFSRPSLSTSTKQKSTSPVHDTVKITAMPRETDDYIKATITSDKEEKYKTWFDKVYEKADA